ncbi:MAG: flagellar M-ring protein FliF [Deltaproteobacteria bacterium]|nr:flagellar M-ring protein FliF [Deltaproteobacteria bacterium]
MPGRSPDSMDNLKHQLSAFWNGLDESRRRILMLAVVAALAVVVGVGAWASQPSFVMLSRVSDGDARAAVTDQLSRAGVRWRVAEDGATIEVREEDEALARREAAGEHGLVGIDGVEQLDPWVTPFQEQLHKQRMLQNDLVKAINGIEGVEKSTVHLNIRGASDFLSDHKTSTAAVTVRSNDGVTLTREIGRSIARLVSHSVAGMTEAEVSVIDQRTGRALWAGERSDEPDAAVSDAAQRRGERIAAQATEALAAVLGSPEKVRVTVSVDLTTASTQSTVNAIDPDSAAAMKEKLETQANGSTKADGGAAGVSSNTPEAAAASNGSTTSKREQVETAYQYTTTQTTTVQPAGEVKRLSAAVYIDQSAVAALAAAGGLDEAAMKATLAESVRAAMGADDKRGDSVVVSFVPFAEVPMSDAELAAPGLPWEGLAKSAVALAAVVLAFLFVVRPLVRQVSVAKSGSVDETGRVLAEIGDEPSSWRRGAAPVDGGVDDENVIDLAARLRAQVDGFKRVSAEDVSRLVNRETDNSAEVLRRWMRG